MVSQPWDFPSLVSPSSGPHGGQTCLGCSSLLTCSSDDLPGSAPQGSDSNDTSRLLSFLCARLGQGFPH